MPSNSEDGRYPQTRDDAFLPDVPVNLTPDGMPLVPAAYRFNDSVSRSPFLRSNRNEVEPVTEDARRAARPSGSAEGGKIDPPVTASERARKRFGVLLTSQEVTAFVAGPPPPPPKDSASRPPEDTALMRSARSGIPIPGGTARKYDVAEERKQVAHSRSHGNLPAGKVPSTDSGQTSRHERNRSSSLPNSPGKPARRSR
jgi:hypothetical protein